ncbi:MAG: cytochrome oxidase putative small subunit CydP [Iodobacter sp.]|jgi:hypothetical protein
MRIARHLPLWQEITLILIIKVALLTAIWKCFFSEPVAKHMLVPDVLVTERFVGTASSPTQLP